MLSAAQLARMRTMQAATMDKSAAVVRDTITQDAAGRPVETPATVATVPCRIAPARAADREGVEASRVVGQVLWRVTVPALTDVHNADRLVVGSRNFEVLAVWGEESRETARICLAVER